MEQSIYNKHLILSIIPLVNGYKEVVKAQERFGDQQQNSGRNYFEDCKNSLIYLLNQTVRQFHLDSTHFFVSKKAKECWNDLVIDSHSIESCFFREKISCKNVEHPEEYPKYVGARKVTDSSCIITKNKKDYFFYFNDLFHCEHIVPVCQIVDALLKLDNPSETSVFDILNKIYICKMLKEEDRTIQKKSNRGNDLDYIRIYKTIYHEAGIIIENLEQ